MREGLDKIVSEDETIVAISTPLGHSAIGLIRISGRECLSIAARYFKANTGNLKFGHRIAQVGSWYSEGERLDEVVLTFFQAPNSYTGEDLLEISAHGNPFVLRRIVECVRGAGGRLAKPGEFTLRAVAHGKMDLVQAEAVREFIEAQTEQQAKTALRQMDGALSKRIRPIKDKLVDVIAHLEAGIDFAEDDVHVPENAFLIDRIRPPRLELDALKETFGYGKILGRGLRLVILGKPNVGKSSLFNRLVSADRAIVTDIPGTTRDVLTEVISFEGVPLCFADTAGIRHTVDKVESMGVSRSIETAAEADFAIVVLDGSTELDDNDRHVLQRAEHIPNVVVINKNDLPQRVDVRTLNGANRVSLSAKTGEGLEDLQAALRAFLLSCKTDLNDDLTLTNARQFEAITNSTEALRVAEQALTSGVPHEMVLTDIYRAVGALDELTGEILIDDILDRIFASFCIGK